jgi:hypothetical protein
LAYGRLSPVHLTAPQFLARKSKKIHKTGEFGMAKATKNIMNYYENLVKNISQSMKAHPNSAMVMDMNSFQILAKSQNLKSLSRKMPDTVKGVSTIVFQKRNQKAAWIL